MLRKWRVKTLRIEEESASMCVFTNLADAIARVQTRPMAPERASADSVPASSPYTGSHNILSPAVLDVSPSQQRVSHNKECAKQERTLTSKADTQRKIVLLNKY